MGQRDLMKSRKPSTPRRNSANPRGCALFHPLCLVVYWRWDSNQQFLLNVGESDDDRLTRRRRRTHTRIFTIVINASTRTIFTNIDKRATTKKGKKTKDDYICTRISKWRWWWLLPSADLMELPITSTRTHWINCTWPVGTRLKEN